MRTTSTDSTDSTEPLARVAALPGVAEAVEESRVAVDQLRAHRVLRRHSSAVSVEAALRGAHASARLEGAETELAEIRAGTVTDPRVLGALRLSGELGQLATTWSTAPQQALARLHALAAADAVPAAELGRPRVDDGPAVADPHGLGAPPPAAEMTQRLTALGALLTARTSAPALVLAAIVHGELQALRPFTWGSGLVARAAERLTLVERGLDPKSLAPVELGHARLPEGYARALRDYVTGTPEGVSAWVRHCADAVRHGARDSLATCEALRRG